MSLDVIIYITGDSQKMSTRADEKDSVIFFSCLRCKFRCYGLFFKFMVPYYEYGDGEREEKNEREREYNGRKGEKGKE